MQSTQIENISRIIEEESCGYTFLGYTEGRSSSLEPDGQEMAEIERAAKDQAVSTLIISDVSRLSRKTDKLIGLLEYIAQIPMNLECTNGMDLSVYSPLNDIELTISNYLGGIELKHEAEYEQDCNYDDEEFWR